MAVVHYQFERFTPLPMATAAPAASSIFCSSCTPGSFEFPVLYLSRHLIQHKVGVLPSASSCYRERAVGGMAELLADRR